ncbi:MAG: ChbG/HpnK family deacetylase [Candidatus Methylomirabilales bacterium]
MPVGTKDVVRVVVNADDFGLHESVNEGVVRAHREGIVTSASLMACGTAFEDALTRCRSFPELGIGIHLTLIEERPVAPVEKISSLVGQDGAMPRSYMAFARGWLTGSIREHDVHTELKAQVERVLENGIHPSHLDSHQQVHCLPGVWKLTLDLAKKYAVPYVRLPAFDSLLAEARSPMLPMIRAGVNLMAVLRRLANARSVKFADHVKGFAFSGRMTTSRLLAILETLRPGLTEVMVHPGLPDEDLRRRYCGWGDFNWETELHALTDPLVVARCRRGDFTPTSFAGAGWN